MVSPRVDKGRLTVLRTGESRDFSLNPNDINDTKDNNFPSFQVPGISNPIYNYGSGGDRDISFTLRLDGDVGKRLKRRTASIEAVQQIARGEEVSDQNADISLSINDEIAWYEQFEYSEGNARLGLPEAQVDILLFTFGVRYRGVRVFMARCHKRIMQWTPRLDPTRADLEITLRHIPSRSVRRSEIYDRDRNRGF